MSVTQQTLSSPATSPHTYERLLLQDGRPASYNGQPVLYDRAQNDLALEGLQEGQILPLPVNAEMGLRKQLRLPRRRICHLPDQPGAFVELHPFDGPKSRRGEVLHATDHGITLRVVTHGSQGLAAATSETWPWTSIVYLAAARPDQQECVLLKMVAS